MDVSKNSGTVPPSRPFYTSVFHYKPSILGYPYFWKHPYGPRKLLPNTGTGGSLEGEGLRQGDGKG